MDGLSPIEEAHYRVALAAAEQAVAPLVEALGRPPRLAYTVAEVAAMLGVSDRTVDRFIEQGSLATLPYTARPRLVSKVELDRFVTAAPAQPRPVREAS